MRLLTFSFLIARACAGVIPRDDGRETSTGGGVTRTISLPPLPTGLPIKWPPAGPFANREAEAEAEPVADAAVGQFFQGTPDPDKVHVTGLTYAGSGCPANSAAYALSDDLTTLTLLLSEYVASIGPGVAVTQNRKNCQLNLKLQYPGGFQYSIFQATYRGYAALDKGISGKQTATYYFSGQTAQTSSHTNWTGPYTDNYELTDQAVSASIVWSPCGQQGLLNINSQIALTATDKKASGLLTTDSVDASFVQKLYIRWQKC